MDPAQQQHIESAVAAFYSGSQEQMAAADGALSQVRAQWWDAGPWRLLEALCLANAATPTVLWASALTEQWLRRRWRRISEPDRASCRLAAVQLVIGAQQSRGSGGRKRPSLSENSLKSSKLEHLLATLLRADWPSGWPSFVPDLVAAPEPRL